MPEVVPDSSHFARAVIAMAERRTVFTHATIHNQQGLKLIEKGVAVDQRLYDLLTQHRLRPPLAECVTVQDAVSGVSLRDDALALAGSEPLFCAMLAMPGTRDIVPDELALIPLPAPIALQLTTMRETQNELWLHSLRSALMAGWLAQRSGGARYDVRMLCAAGLLHDLGMLHLDPVLLEPVTRFDREQRRQLYSHPLVTVLLLERHQEYPRELLQAVMEHHEARDGSGYPRQVSGTAMSRWGGILALTEVATALVTPGRKASGLRASMALRLNHRRFDAELVRELLPLLPGIGGDAEPPAQDDPMGYLRHVDELLRAWPDAARVRPDPGPARLRAVSRVGEQCAQVLSMLAAAGMSAAQLAQVGPDERDESLDSELALVAQEAQWQLRALSRQARRLWRLAADEALPLWLQEWLGEAERLQH